MRFRSIGPREIGLYGLLIATLVLSFVVQVQLMEYVWREMATSFDFRVRFVPTFHLIEQSLAGLPDEQWPARFREASARFGLPARLAPAALPERTRFKAGEAESFQHGAIVSLEREGGASRW